MLTRTLRLSLAALLPAGAAAAQAARPTSTNADVPVSKVVLFSSGVGYFEHSGTVHGNSSTELRFKTSQINDILKSLVLQDRTAGKVGTITYPSQDPIAKTLQELSGRHHAESRRWRDLLNQLRGPSVTIQSQAERLTARCSASKCDAEAERQERDVDDRRY